MYYVEMVIDGVLHFRTDPYGVWRKMTLEQLTRKLVNSQKREHEFRCAIAKHIAKHKDEALHGEKELWATLGPVL